MKSIIAVFSALSLFVVTADGADIRICVQTKEEGNTSPLAGATVSCYDEDYGTDDLMATASTASNGCVVLSYKKKSPKWYNPCTAWDCSNTNPDIYCKVTKADYLPLYTNTKENFNQNKLADFGTVNIYPDLADIHICVQTKEEGSTTPLAGATVSCYDEDYPDTDDHMATASTASNGCAVLSYKKKSPSQYNPCTAWDCLNTNPDIYCKVTKADYFPLYTNTKENFNQKYTANFGTVNIYPDRVARGDHGDVNGCGPSSSWDGINDVADFLTGFEDQCNNLDLCYNNCNESKEDCDTEFNDMMYSKCNDSYDTQTPKNLCKTVASGMHNVANEFGSEAFNDSQCKYSCLPPSVCLCSGASGPFSNSVVEQMVDSIDGISAESRELLVQLDPLTASLVTILPDLFIDANANPSTDEDLSTEEVNVGWTKTGTGFYDWKPAVETPETVRLQMENFHITTLDEDDFTGPLNFFEDLARKAVTNSDVFPLTDTTIYADSTDQAARLLEDLNMNSANGKAMRASYNSDFDMVSDESFSRIFFYSAGAPLLASQTEISSSEHGPFVVDLDLSHLPMRQRYRPLGVRIHFGADQLVSAIFDYDSRVLYKQGDDGWEDAKFLARSTLGTVVVFREHLFWCHLLLSNSATRLSQLTLPPSHPIRRLLTVFTYRSTDINIAAVENLVKENALLHRAPGFEFEGMEQIFKESFESSNIFEPFPQRTVNQALLDLAEQGRFPYLTEGIEYYIIVEEFVKDWLAESGTATIESDNEAMAFYEEMRLSSLGQSYEIPPYSNNQSMVDLLSQIIFSVTAYHELVGNVVDFAVLPERFGFRVSSHCDQHQVDIQSFLISAVIACTTSVRMPYLIGDFVNFFGAGEAPSWERTVWDKFQEELKKKSLKVQAADANREVEFKYFDPARFECSVSL